jgi:RND superfamily putative drug exporter
MRSHLSLAAIGRWSAGHPWRAIGVWLLFVAFAVAALALTGSKQLTNGGAGESARGDALLNRHQVGLSQREYVYLHSDALDVGAPGFQAALAAVSARVRSALGSPVTVEVSSDRHSALVGGEIRRAFSIGALQAAVGAVAAAHPGLTTAAAGADSGGGNDLRRAELLSVPVTLLVLLLAFGTFVAALVPVLLAASAVVAAFGLLGPISQVFPLDGSVKTVVLLLGMAVGVDYALFYVARSREERQHGLPTHQALERTARTSGRTVLIAGTTVATAVAAQYVIGSDIFNGIASGTIAVIACAVAGSVTVLPGLLELLGPRIDRGRIPFLPHLHADGADARFWPALIDRVLRRPVLAVALSAGLLLGLAVPALGLHVAKPSSDGTAQGQNAAAARVAADFPGISQPALVVLAGSALQQRRTARAVRRLEALVAAREIAHRPFTLDAARDRQAAAIELPLTGLGDNAASRHAIIALRTDLVPRTLGRIPGLHTAVTGATAEDLDFTQQMKHGIPYVIGFVLVLAFLLLLVTFRSIVVPLKAIALNLLAVAASTGVLVLVFQHHWAESLLGFHSDGAIISWLPLFLFVVLFGLSMDYHVFILSRIREGVDQGMSTDDALRHGITRTAGVVTSAALVMVGVFSLFATASELELKQAGIGLATAILLDATIIRGILLPASMKLLGERNWYLPSRLTWLPSTSHAKTGTHEPATGLAAAAITSD